jgi:transcriptional regulator with XRE-family HTH domain
MLRRTTRAKNVQARVGLSFQQIQKYEKGKNCVGSGRLAKIAEALDVPVARLFDSSVEGPHGPITGGVVTDPLAQHHAMAMLKAFAKLSPDLQLSLVVLVERMAEHSSN